MLGFSLVSTGARNYNWPALPYRGVDRGYMLPSPEELDDMRAAGRARTADLWDDWWNAKEEGLFADNENLAVSFTREFVHHGVEVELIFISRLGANQRPTDAVFLGFDVSRTVETFHSVITEPEGGLIEPTLPRVLNANGLFDDSGQAARLAE